MTLAAKNPVNVLLVDDTPANLVALEAILGASGYRLVTASSGLQALELIEKEKYGVILLDVMMPGIDGFEVAHRTKEGRCNKDTPIIFVTAVARDHFDISRGYALGGADFLIKPLNEDEVRAKVKVFTDLYQARRDLTHLNRNLEQLAADRANELAATSQRFRLFVEGVKEYALIQTDAQGVFITWNAGAERLLGYSAEEIIGLPFRMIFTLDDIAAAVPETELALAVHQGQADDTRWHRRKDGSLFWAHGITTALWDDRRRLCGFAKVLRDYTEKKTADDAVKASESLLRIIANSVPALVCYINHEHRYQFANEAYGDWFGIRPERILGQHLRDVFGLDLYQKVRPHLEGALAGKESAFDTVLPSAGAKDDRYIAGSYSPDLRQDGSVRGAVGLVYDVTAQKRTELAKHQADTELSLTQARLAAIVTSSDDAIIAKTLNGTVTSWNTGAERIFGYLAGEIIGKPITILIPPDRQQEEQHILSSIVRGERIEHFETTRVRKDGSMVAVSLSISAVFDPFGQIIGIAKIARDITEQKRVEKELQLAKEAAEAANAAKSLFLANMSHEIRTPLAAIIGFVDLLVEDHELTANERLDFAGTIRRNGRLLTDLVDDILDLSKVEAGELTVEHLRFSLPELVDDIRTLLGRRAREKGLDLLVRSDGPVPEEIVSDPTRLKQILLNIIGNAIKFTRAGHVDVSISLQPPADGTGSQRLTFVIKDTGKGITQQQALLLFRPFSQADETTTRQFGGTGLGLVLSRRLAEALGGDVTLIKSELDKGSTFSVVIDPGHVSGTTTIGDRHGLRPRHGAERLLPKSPLRRLQSLKVLVAEDTPDGRLLIERRLKKEGAEVDTARNGREAIDQAMKKDHDFVLMDIQMPEVDGLSATAELRRRGYRQPIIALTAHALDKQREEAAEAGCSGHICKPINFDELVGFLVTHERH